MAYLHFEMSPDVVRRQNILWHVDALLDNDREVSSYAISVAN
jgi:hypothetical protein